MPGRSVRGSSTEPLYGFRLRTPRLELRLGSRAELEEFAYLARAGIHSPAEMPFAVAWTDRAFEPDFVDTSVAFHEAWLDRADAVVKV